MLTLLTATGNRPEAWALCEEWMRRQIYLGPVKWIVVDDGEEAQPITFSRPNWDIEVVRPFPRWSAGQNTQARNLLAGLRLVGPGDRLVIIEDDDHYKYDWLKQVSIELDRAELVGEMLARYYNMQTRGYKQLSNRTHASLCSTAVRGRAIHALRQACGASPKFIDMRLWRNFKPGHLFSGNRVTGIKGLSGRMGIGMGHKLDFSGTKDREGAILRQWIGQDAECYEYAAASVARA